MTTDGGSDVVGVEEGQMAPMVAEEVVVAGGECFGGGDRVAE